MNTFPIFVETADSILQILREGELSYDEKYSALCFAIRAEEYNPDGSYRYIESIYDTYFIFRAIGEEGGAYFKASYQLDDNGKATVGSPSEVKRVVSWEDVLAEALLPEGATIMEGAFVKLVEANSDTGEILVKIIEAGWGSSGYYSAEMLKRDGATAFPVGTKMFWNHPTATEQRENPARNLDYLAAVLIEAAKWDENGSAGPGLYAKAQVKTHYREKVKTLAEDIGASIYAAGKFEPGQAEGKSGRIVTQLLASVFNTVDFVTYPGCGGEIIALFESARPDATPTENNMTQEEKEALEASKRALETANTTISDLTRKLAAAQIYPTAREAAKSALANVTMPAPAREKVIESAARNPIVKEDGTLDVEKFAAKVVESANAELSYLAESNGQKFTPVVGGSPVHGAGASGNAALRESAAPAPGGTGKVVVQSSRASNGLI